jgi:hypothetical protein
MSSLEMQAIEVLQEEIVAMAAESLAMQFVLTCLLQRIVEGNPALRGYILQAFDDAANQAENFSIVRGIKSGHVPETLRIIEQMRLLLTGRDEPKREV